MKAITDTYLQEKIGEQGYQTVILANSLTPDRLGANQEDPLEEETKSDKELSENMINDDYIKEDDAHFEDEH